MFSYTEDYNELKVLGIISIFLKKGGGLMIIRFDYVPLAKQLVAAFEAIGGELKERDSGEMFLELENNMILMFGLIGEVEGRYEEKHKRSVCKSGMSDEQLDVLRHAIEEALARKRYWRQGRLEVAFAVKGKELQASVRIASEYDFSALFDRNEKHL